MELTASRPGTFVPRPRSARTSASEARHRRKRSLRSLDRRSRRASLADVLAERGLGTNVPGRLASLPSPRLFLGLSYRPEARATGGVHGVLPSRQNSSFLAVSTRSLLRGDRGAGPATSGGGTGELSPLRASCGVSGKKCAMCESISSQIAPNLDSGQTARLPYVN